MQNSIFTMAHTWCSISEFKSQGKKMDELIKKTNQKKELKRAITLMLEAQSDGLARVYPTKDDSVFTRKIVELSKRYDADISKDDTLMNHVNQLEALGVITEDLYPAVAEILAHIYKLSNNKRVN